jgi:di/tricarboxylate transporter
MSDITIVYLVLAAAVALFISGKVPVSLVAVGVALALWATGILSLEAALSGFGDPTVLFIASLFVVSEGLDATGVTAWAGAQLVARAGEGRMRLVLLTMLLCAALTAVISVNGAVAALLPVVVVIAVRTGRLPSQLLLPLVFGAHAGSMLTLTGTPVNVIVSTYAQDVTGQGFGFFEFAFAGVPLLLGTIAVVLLLGPRLIPERRPRVLPADLSRHARTLVDQYGLEDSPVARGVAATTAGVDPGAGPVTQTHVDVATALVGPGSGLAEVIIPPRSSVIGDEVFPGMVTESGDLVVLAIQRGGEDMGHRKVTLQAGDALLLQGSWEAIENHAGIGQLLAVESPALIRRQAVPMGPGAGRAIAVLAAMIVALATGVVPSAVAGLVAAGALVLLRVVSIDGAYRSVNWTTVVLVAGMIPLSAAMTETGAAGLIADLIVGLVGDLGPSVAPYALLAGLFAVTATFGQLISNMATALIVIPIALAAAADLGVDVRPVLMSVTVAASAAYLTPVATPVNLMVMEPAGYRFGDYWRLGLPLLAVTFVVAVVLVPVVWPF